MGTMRINASELRQLSLEDLEKKYADVKTSLLHVRQKQISSDVKPTELYYSKRNVACVMTVLREKRLEEIIKSHSLLKKKLPKQLRPKLTRKRRNALSTDQLNKMRNGKSKFYGTKRLVYAY